MRALALFASVALALGCGAGVGTTEVDQEPVDSGIAAQADSTPSTYPAGPYGTVVGGVLEPHAFIGRKNGVPKDGGPYDRITLEDYYAMRLTGKKFLVFNVAALWSPPSRGEATQLEKELVPAYAPKGVVFLSIVLDKADHTSAAPLDVDAWITSQGLTYPVASDPDRYSTTLIGPGVPANVIVDLSNMKIVSKGSGASLPQIAAQLDTLLGGG